MQRYKQNLHIEGNKVISYTTHVATISGRKLLVHGWWSVTTSKHVNYVASEYGLEVVKDAPKEEEVSDYKDHLKSIGAIAAIGEFFANTQKEKNDWKARMLRAGLEGQGFIFPDNWDELSEDEKEKRLNGVIEIATKG